MKNKGLLIVVVILIIAVIAAAIILYYPKENGGNENNGVENGSDGDGGSIGGQEDSHGCLVGAGYSWNESIGACVREWELNSDARRAAEIAVAPLSYYVTITEVNKQDCEGCYAVKLQRNDNRQMTEVNLKNWVISSDTNGSSDGGNVEGKKTYCTAGQRGSQICTMEYMPVCGWFDESIQCVKYPCAQTYSNPCAACSEAKVAYWTAGECPK